MLHCLPQDMATGLNLAGLPAEVVTNFTPDAQTNLSIASSLRNRIGKFTPNGKPSAAIFLISAWQLTVSPDEVSITPRPPARDTALASCVRAIQPMGACTMGNLAPVWAKTRLVRLAWLSG